MPPPSPRPGAGGVSNARPTSELLGGSGGYQQTPEAEALDAWFENLQNYEATLEEMAAASLDVNFKEELSAIEQWFKVLSEAERTAALYSLLQHSTQVQIRFFITVLQQMARSDPMTALLSPAMGSMQSQMEAKLASLSLKSPGLKSNMPASPTTRSFGAGNRQSLVIDSPPSNFLSPDSAAAASNDAAATLAQQRAKFKASNAAHRISAPVLAGAGSPGSASWGSQLGQVAESTSTNSNSSNGNTNANGGAQEITIPSATSRPKSSDFSGTVGSPRPEAGDSWASMVNTPLIPMFSKTTSGAGGSASLGGSSLGASPGVPRMGDPTVHRRVPKSSSPANNHSNNGPGEVYDDSGNLVSQNHNQNSTQNKRNANMWGSGAGAGGARSPALSNTSSHHNPNANDILAMQMGMNPGAFGMGLGGLNMGALSPGLGVPGMGLGGMGVGGMPFNLNLLNAMGISPEAQAQILAAQMAQAQAQMGGGFNAMGLGMQQNNRRAPSARSASGGNQNVGANASGGNKSSTPSAPSDIDPALLNDVPAWLRSLRLHKYTPNFTGMNWEDLVMMSEDELEAKGVAALGARRKMIKTFELVRKRMGMGEFANGQGA